MSDKTRHPMSLGSQRFWLAVVAVVALLAALAGLLLTEDTNLRLALMAVISTGLAEPVRSAFRHFFPLPKGETSDPPPHG